MEKVGVNVLAIDYDGVLHDDKNPVEGRRMGAPIEGAKEAMITLKNRGYDLIIHTVRGSSPQHVIDWLNYYEIPFDEVTDKKIVADWYIDDHALRFTSWPQVLTETDNGE